MRKPTLLQAQPLLPLKGALFAVKLWAEAEADAAQMLMNLFFHMSEPNMAVPAWASALARANVWAKVWSSYALPVVYVPLLAYALAAAWQAVKLGGVWTGPLPWPQL